MIGGCSRVGSAVVKFPPCRFTQNDLRREYNRVADQLDTTRHQTVTFKKILGEEGYQRLCSNRGRFERDLKGDSADPFSPINGHLTGTYLDTRSVEVQIESSPYGSFLYSVKDEEVVNDRTRMYFGGFHYYGLWRRSLIMSHLFSPRKKPPKSGAESISLNWTSEGTIFSHFEKTRKGTMLLVDKDIQVNPNDYTTVRQYNMGMMKRRDISYCTFCRCWRCWK